MRLLLFSLLLTSFATVQAAQINNVQSFPGKVEIHVKPELNELDVLFVVDNSGSMTTFQKSMIDNVPALTQTLIKSGVHVHAGVTTTDMDPMSRESGSGGRFTGNVKVADSKLSDFGSVLSRNLAVGVNGSATERPLAAIQAALSEPVLSVDHPEFYRPRAQLAVVVLTDAADQSENVTPKSITTFLQSLKTGMDKQVTLSSIQVVDEKSECAKNGEDQSPKMAEAVKLLGGKLVDICASDFGSQLGNLGLDLVKKVTLEIPLTTAPVVSSIVVTFGATTLVAGDMHYGWVYDSAKNAVILGDKIDWSSLQGDDLVVSFVPDSWK